MKKIYKKYFGEILIALGALSYSFEWYFIRKLDSIGYTSYDITFAKLFITGIIIFLFYTLFNRNIYKENILKTKDYIGLLSLSIFAILGNVLFNQALILTSISNVLILIYLSVFWSIIFGILFFKEKYNLKKFIYACLAFIGIILVLVKSNGNINLMIGLGEFYAFLVSILLGLSIIITKKMSHFSAFYRVMILFLIASFILIIFISAKNGINYIGSFFNKDFIIYGGVLAITAGLLGRGLKDLGTKYVPASLVIIIMLLEPIGQITTGYFIAGETLTLINIIGMILVFYSIIKISKKEA